MVDCRQSDVCGARSTAEPSTPCSSEGQGGIGETKIRDHRVGRGGDTDLPQPARARIRGATGEPTPGARLVGGTSLNWAGYSATSTSGFTSVTATWSQPAVVAGSSSESYAAFWVGLDGDGSSTVEQIGTMGYTVGKRVYYVAWYEMYPEAMQEIGMTIAAGDVLSGTVRWMGSSSFKLTLVDETSGRTFTTTQSSTTAERASAEVISEAPSSSSGDVLSLAKFGLVIFAGCAVTTHCVTGFG